VDKPPVRSLGDFLDHEIVLPPMLVDPGLVARGAVHVMYARGGKGKTAVSLNRLVKWAAGRPMFDELPDVMKPTKPLRTLIVENEGAPAHFQRILARIVNGKHDDERIFDDEQTELIRSNISIWGDGGWSKMKLDDPDNLDLVKRGIEAAQADILFLEPFRGIWKGDEQDSTAMSNVLDALSEIANEYSIGVLLTHHERKTNENADHMDASRGSTAFEGHCAVMERWRSVSSGHQRELLWAKNRFEPEPPPVRMKFVRERWGYEYVAEDANVRRVMAVLHQVAPDYIAVPAVADELNGEDQQQVRRWLNKAVDNGAAIKSRRDNTYMYRVKSVTSDEADYAPLGLT
jgi:hypothetical protein